MLPEEGFPVFYRYFRDRISWYEADAVCQFHHANLVTADSSSQYDAIRAYLKELDITEKVWIGLSKTSEKPNFLWTDFRPLSGEGHWQEALPAGESQSLCAVMDPAADFLWRPLPCGGPEVAAFICELPIPSWALGPKGCLLTELPSLTVLYIPEQSALELTSDCGLDGTKRIACKGNADREEILRQLTCVISNEDMDEDKPPKTSTSDYYETSTSDENSLISKTPKSWTSNTISVDYGMPTRHRRETEDTLSPMSTKSSFKEVSTKDLSWQDTHKEKTVLTTQHIRALDDHVTPTPATSFDVDRMTGSTTVVESAPTLDSSITDKISSIHSVNDKVTAVVDQQTEQSITPMDQKTTESLVKTEHHTRFTTVRPNTTKALTINTKDVSVSPANEKLKSEIFEGTSSTTTQEGNVEEYPSAINQGQLFSIIENGTMFDIIELNETESESQNKIRKSGFKITTTVPISIVETNKFTASTDYSVKTTVPTKKNTTKKPVQPTKKYNKIVPSKKDVVANDNAQKPIIKIQSVDQLEENLTKEFEMMPDIKDTSIFLNRTFRKELPAISDENTGLESGGQYGVPKILNFTITNTLELEEKINSPDQVHQEFNGTKIIVLPQNNISKTEAELVHPKIVDIAELNDNSVTTASPEGRNIKTNNNLKPKTELQVKEILEAKINIDKNIKTKEQTTKETTTDDFHNPIDPRIYMLNHHPNMPKNNESEPVSIVKAQSSTQEPKVAKEEFLPKSLLGEKKLSAEPTTHTDVHPETSDAYAEHPFPSDEPKKINRHRNLHTNKQRKFYPYFFSRMLG